jgi:hypothetical protein
MATINPSDLLNNRFLILSDGAEILDEVQIVEIDTAIAQDDNIIYRFTARCNSINVQYFDSLAKAGVVKSRRVTARGALGEEFIIYIDSYKIDIDVADAIGMTGDHLSVPRSMEITIYGHLESMDFEPEEPEEPIKNRFEILDL